VRPGMRAADFPAGAAIVRACRAVTDFAPPDDAHRHAAAWPKRA
jgi:hypothetical protein